MFHRGVSILVLIGYVALQLAAIPHAHAHSDEQARPHVHVDWLTHGRTHHGHCHHHHPGKPGHAHTHHHEAPSPAPAETPAPVDHDESAVYLPDVVARVTSSDVQRLPVDMTWQALVLPAAAAMVSPSGAGIESHAPPDRYAPGCALILKLRNLRI